ncbi:MAG: hypothetical protein AB1461_01885 [Thermodesulfobacteriota bacterium]
MQTAAGLYEDQLEEWRNRACDFLGTLPARPGSATEKGKKLL